MTTHEHIQRLRTACVVASEARADAPTPQARNRARVAHLKAIDLLVEAVLLTASMAAQGWSNAAVVKALDALVDGDKPL